MSKKCKELLQNCGRRHSMAQVGSRGQILIEYVLLMLIGLMVAQIMIKRLTAQGTDNDSRGIITRRWIDIWGEIGADYPDK